MKYSLLIIVLLAQNSYGVQSPKQIAGYELAANVAAHQSSLRTETALPIRFMEYLDEVEVIRRPGFKSGYLAYGNCASVGSIARIKLKYEDSSKEFYNELLKKYKSRFGEPSRWQGDPFHIVLAWKWVFSDKGRNIELFLQHNTMDYGKKLGNSVKLTDLDLIEAERKCFKDKFPDFRKPVKNKGLSQDWSDLIPE